MGNSLYIYIYSSQLDLSIEARNLKIFNECFKREKWALFPQPIDGFVSKNVLVETFMEGTPIKVDPSSSSSSFIYIIRIMLTV